MSFAEIGMVLVIVAVPTFVIAVGYFAYLGMARVAMLVKLGVTKEKEIMIEEEQKRWLNR